jgi:hypothetical protein
MLTLSVGRLILQVIAPAVGEAAADVRRLKRDDAAFANTIFPVENELEHWPPGIGITSSRFLEFGDVEI